ncbi:MAG: peptidoglycan DD-metalloendopeptidase family protein [Actinomycetota bacterium]|nr:peptidoglycan DD-metalloendopeptidase family protein [Actinomycetota bacterium]
MKRRFTAYIATALCLYFVLPLPAQTKPLPEKIGDARERVERKRKKEGVLSTDISRYALRIRSLQGEIRSVSRRQSKLEVEVSEKRAELNGIRTRLERARHRLELLRERLIESQRTLADRLVAIYKDGEPDILSVVLASTSFGDFLDRTEFLDRIADQDHKVITRVRRVKREVTGLTNQLTDLEVQAEAARNAILSKRNQVLAIKNGIVGRRDELAQVRDGRAAILRRVRTSRHHAEEDLAALERLQARVSAQVRGAGSGPTPAAGPIRRGSGRFIWPVNGPVTSPFGQRWGRLHAGIDISAGSGTPIRAAASGRVILLGPTGGYGNYVCVGHGGGISTCYAHLSSYSTSGGASVRQGQVIGAVGCTGHCFGDHLHFEVRVNGSPVDPLGYL